MIASVYEIKIIQPDAISEFFNFIQILAVSMMQNSNVLSFQNK
jgi:hypothetical protein